MNELLKIERLCLQFGGQQVLRDVSFSVCRGEVVGLIGPNGAGKTSVINCIMRSYTPSAGSITFADVDILSRRAHSLASLGIARTFQNVELSARATVMDNVLLGLHSSFHASWAEAMLNLPRSRNREREAREEAREALARVGFRDDPGKRVADLSFGRQKLVEIARCLVGNPPLILLDEPVAGLSEGERHNVADLLSEIRQRDETTMLIVEHDVGFVTRVADRLVALNFGEVVAAGVPNEVLETAQFRISFLGEDLEDPSVASETPLGATTVVPTSIEGA